MYANYIKERLDRGYYESEHGFATYKISGQECYIIDIYVEPGFRKTDEASSMADAIVEIAKDAGCKYLTGSVAPSANGSTASIKVLFGYGFRVLRSENDFIWFIKEIQ